MASSHAGRVPLPPKSQPRLREYVLEPWTPRAQRSPALRRWCDRHGYITPHFTWASYACTDGTPVPWRYRGNARRLHLKLEILRHEIGDQPVSVDGPFRTRAKNAAVGGAQLSQHLYAAAADFFVEQVDRWVAGSKALKSRADVVRIANRHFKGVGNETSGTLHVDVRKGPIARFVSWVGV
jgi:hypothetical protein